MRSKSLLVKLILFGSVLSIIPVVFVGVFSYIQSSNQVQKQVNQAELQFIKQVNSNIEQILFTVNHTLTNLVDSTVMDNALHNPLDAANFRLYNNLKSEIIHLQSFDTKVEDLIILNKRQDWLIKNSGIRRLSEHQDQEKYMSFFNLEHPTSWVLLDNKKFEDPISSYGCPYTISLIKKLPSIIIEKYALAFANIPACSIAQMIEGGQEAEEVMIINEDQQIVVHPNHAMLGTYLSDHPIFNTKIDFEEPSGQLHITYDNRPITVTYHKSNFNKWIYLSIVSIDKLTKESRQIGWFTFFICLFIITISFIFVWMSTKRLYLPFNRLVKSIEGNPSEASSKQRSEVQVIEEHIKHLFSSKAKLEHEIKDHMQQIKSLFLNRLFSGSLKQSEIDEKMEYFGFDQQVRNWKHMNVFTLQVDTLENTRYEQKDMELLLFAVSNIVEETIPKASRLPIVFFERSLVILIGFEEEDVKLVEDRIFQLTESMKALIERYLDLSVSIGISLLFKDIKQAARAYDEGLEALKHRIKLGKGVIIPYSSISSGKPFVLYEYPVRVEHELVDAIKIADEKESLRLLRTWLEEAIHKVDTPKEYQLSLMRLLNRLLILKHEAGISFKQLGIQKMSLYEEILKLHVSEEIEEWFKEKLILPLLRVFNERRDSQYQNLSEKIIDLIQNNYDIDFTLEDCAAKLHYNASYLSSVFKNETNYTFTEYLANYRFQMAKQWLTETDMTIKEIAERLRYTNSHNFIRSFRKLEGMTPGQYRAHYSEDRHE